MMTTTACSVISSLLLILAARHCKALLLDGHNCSLSGSQKLAAQQLTNLFENGAFNFDYGMSLAPQASLSLDIQN